MVLLHCKSILSKIHCLVSLVDKMPVYRAEGLGLIPGRTNVQGVKMVEEKVLLLL